MSAEAQRLYRERYPERVKAAIRAWKLAHPKETMESRKRWNDKNPLKKSAQYAIYKAVRNGKIKRLPCEKCGAERSHAHHHKGYIGENRLDVIWLCAVHHKEAHKVCP